MSVSSNSRVATLLSHAEAAGVLRISAKTLYQMNWKGTGPRRHKVGRHCRYDVVDLQAWLTARASS